MRCEGSRRLSRREMLAATLAATGTMAWGPSARGRLMTADDAPYGPFKMGIQSYSLRRFPREDALAKTRELGLRYWESYSDHVPVVTEPSQIAALKTQLDEAGVQVIGYGVIRFTRDHEANRRFFEFARGLGIPYLSADPDRDSFDDLDTLVEEYGVAVGIHNHGPGHQYEKIDTIAEAIKDHHPKIGCCIDTGHFLRSREDPVRAVEVFGNRTYGVHLKDVKDATEFTILGQGDLNTVELLRALARIDYDYCLALEYEENPDAPMDDIRACLAEVRQAVAALG